MAWAWNLHPVRFTGAPTIAGKRLKTKHFGSILKEKLPRLP